MGKNKEDHVVCGRCDVCCRPRYLARPGIFHDCQQELCALLRVAHACAKFKLSATMPYSVVAGRLLLGFSRAQTKLPLFGFGHRFNRSSADWAAIFDAAVSKGFL